MINKIKKELSKKQGKNILILLHPIGKTNWVIEKISANIKPKIKKRNELFYKKGRKITVLSAHEHNTRGWGPNTKIMLIVGSKLGYEQQREMTLVNTIYQEKLQIETLEDFLNSKINKNIFEKMWEGIIEFGERIRKRKINK